MTYQNVLDEWWTFYQKEIKGSSISSLTSSVNDFKEAFETEIKVKNIDTKYIQHFLNDLDISRSKLERYKMILNLSLDYAVNLEYIKDNPARRAKLPKQIKTIEELEKTE